MGYYYRIILTFPQKYKLSLNHYTYYTLHRKVIGPYVMKSLSK